MGVSVAKFPPKVEWLQAWAMMFRCGGTFSNYLGYAKVGCILVKEETGVFDHPAVKRAKDSDSKSCLQLVKSYGFVGIELKSY